MNRIEKREQKVYVILLILFIALLSFVIYNLQVANAIQDDQNQTRPWVGIKGINITKEIANELKISEPRGVLVTGVIFNSPTENLVLPGDIILKADNITITNKDKLESVIRDKKVGDSLKLIILRDTQEQVINIMVGSRPGLKYISSLEYTNPNSVNFSSYEDFELGIQMKYPSNWENETTQFGTITFRSMPENINDTARDYLKLYVYPVSNRTLEEEISIEKFLQNLTIIQPPHNTSLAGNPALTLEYSYIDDRYGMMKAMKIATQKNDNIYLLTVLCTGIEIQ